MCPLARKSRANQPSTLDRFISSSSRSLHPPIEIDPPVHDADDPVGGFGERQVVGDRDHGLAHVAGQVVQDLPDVGPGAGVQITGRLVGQIADDGRQFFGEAFTAKAFCLQ